MESDVSASDIPPDKEATAGSQNSLCVNEGVKNNSPVSECGGDLSKANSSQNISAESLMDETIKTCPPVVTELFKTLAKSTKKCNKPGCSIASSDGLICGECGSHVHLACTQLPGYQIHRFRTAARYRKFVCEKCCGVLPPKYCNIYNAGSSGSKSANATNNVDASAQVSPEQEEVSQKDTIEELTSERKTLIDLIKEKERELGNYSEQVESLKNKLNENKRRKSTSDVGDGTTGTDVISRLQFAKQRNQGLTRKLEEQSYLMNKTEAAFLAKDELVKAKDEIIGNLKVIIGCLQKELTHAGMTSNTSNGEDAVVNEKNSDESSLRPIAPKNGVKECCEFIEVHATNGAITNGLLLWADIQRKQHPDNNWKTEGVKKFAKQEIEGAKEGLWRVAGESILGKLVKRQGNSKSTSEMNDICMALRTLAEKDAMPMFLCTSGMVAQTPIFGSDYESDFNGKLNNIDKSLNKIVNMISTKNVHTADNVEDSSNSVGIDSRRNLASPFPDIALGGTIPVDDINPLSDAHPGNEWTEVVRKDQKRKGILKQTDHTSIVVSGVGKDVNGIQIAQYLANKDIEIIDWNLLTTRDDATFLTYKITVKNEDAVKAKNLALWPEGTRVRPYKPPATRKKTGYNNQTKVGRNNNSVHWGSNNVQTGIVYENETNVAPISRFHEPAVHQLHYPTTGWLPHWNGTLDGNIQHISPEHPILQNSPTRSPDTSQVRFGNIPVNSLYIPTIKPQKQVRILDRLGADTFSLQY